MSLTYCPICAVKDNFPKQPAHYQMYGWRVCHKHIKDLTPKTYIESHIEDDWSEEAVSQALSLIKERSA